MTWRQGLRIKPPFPTAEVEAGKKLGAPAYMWKTKGQHCWHKIKQNTLYVNGQPQPTSLPVPLLHWYLQMTPAERTKIQKEGPALVVGDTIAESGHLFTVTVVKITSEKDVDCAHRKWFLQKPQLEQLTTVLPSDFGILQWAKHRKIGRMTRTMALGIICWESSRKEMLWI